jgi:hypothetical protein
MRLSARVVLCLLALSLAAGLGCRKPMTPNIDRNEAPETWITAAPMDTLTLRDKDGRPVDKDGNPIIFPVLPTEIPVRFHLYWAGSDKDGAVAGFYYAVVETTAVPVDGFLPPLPGPKPGQYSFTTRTDTTFVFTVSEMFADRKHAFYIYAVDNRGKPDPTPARFIFSAVDKFPPRPVFDLARATGEIVSLTSAGEPLSELRSFDITDTLKHGTLPKDTVPAYSRLDFRWHGELTQPGTFVANYRYKLDELEFQRGDSSVTAVSYGTGLPGSPPVAPGLKVFTLRALDQAAGGGETTRRFFMNFIPDTWWAGPAPEDFPVSTDGEYGSRSVNVIQWPKPGDVGFNTNPPLPAGSTFGPDSFDYRPSRRLPPKRDFERPGTFYEIYKDRLYARTEGDTVHMNSLIVLWNGGYDKDSRYIPRVDSTDLHLRELDGSLATGAVLETAGRVGSPIGFRSQIATRLTPTDLKTFTAQTTLYPVYEPASVFRSPRLGGYWRMRGAGKAFAVARAEDADGGLDNAVNDPVTLAEAVDHPVHGGTPAERAARRKVLVFYVDKAPALVRNGSPEFRPREGESITTVQWNFLLRGMDLDPFDPEDFSIGGGGPTAKTIIRYKVTLYGKDLEGRNTSWTYLDPLGLPYIQTLGGDHALTFIPGGSMANNPFASGPIRVSSQICDCSDCQIVPGQGRCVDGIDPITGEVPPDRADFSANNVINVIYTRPAPEPGLGSTSSTGGRPGPDSSGGGRLR